MFTNEIRLIQKYSLESLKCALMEVRNGTSTILGASKIYGVPRSTIQDRIHCRVSNDARKMGPQTVLWIRRVMSWEIVQRPSKVWIPIKAQDDQRPTPFLNGRPGRKWYIAVITEEYIKKLFNELKTFLTEQKLLTFWMIHRKFSTEMKPALVYALKPKNSWPQNNNSTSGFLSKWSDSDPNNFFPYVIGKLVFSQI